MKDALAIATTSALGAYAFVRGISLFAGGYPDELQMYQSIVNNTFVWEWTYIAYFAAMALVFVLGTYFQTVKHGTAG